MEPDINNNNKNIPAILILLVFFVVIFAAGVLFLNMRTEVEQEASGSKPDETVEEPDAGIVYNYGLDGKSMEGGAGISGTLYFSSWKDGDQVPISIYSLNLDEADPEFVTPNQNFPRMAVDFVSKNNPSLAYFVMGKPSIRDNVFRTGIYSYDYAQASGLLELDVSPAVSKRELTWSQAAGLLAYTARRGGSEGDYDRTINLNEWYIATFNPESGEEFIVEEAGSHPHWSPDGTKMLYLREEGLFVYDFTTFSRNLIIGLADDGDGTVGGSSMLGLSPDGRYLVWSTPSLQLLTIYEITSWDTMTINELGRIQTDGTEYYWPVFSPDSNYYVVQAIDAVEGSDERVNPRLEFRYVLGREVIKSIPLDEFDFMRAFTDDWTTKF